MPSEDLVPGDLVLLESGDKVPADLRLVRVTELHVNESALTGESVPVHKDAVALPEATPVADRCNMVYSGTLVTAGHGAGIAVATGAETELVEIHRLVGAAETLMTPLTAKLAWFSRVLTIAILGLAAVTFAGGIAAPPGLPSKPHRRDRPRGRGHPEACRPPSPSRWLSVWPEWPSAAR
ncbi:E1-E2 ATPase family protein [Mycobacterium kansasii 662]|uniref:E1-E2 ATPase family protein n=1 Tax=Mycobacterium kansasii 662 TaxID=1299326 RepID=X7Z9J6_MYCKA|nr:E1-E2 ATPase family protein [Mycobacterium kansasii 662]